MSTTSTTATPALRLVTPAVERVTAWHREHSMRQARAAFEAMRDDAQDDDAEEAPLPDAAARLRLSAPLQRPQHAR